MKPPPCDEASRLWSPCAMRRFRTTKLGLHNRTPAWCRPPGGKNCKAVLHTALHSVGWQIHPPSEFESALSSPRAEECGRGQDEEGGAAVRRRDLGVVGAS